jgi:kinetochore protein NDC80
MASMKRMTLSTLGDGALNSRPSLGARLGAPGVKPVARGSLGKRESLDKRQSLSTKHSQAIKKLTDPRPISDRAFMNQSIRAIIAYLSTHGYNAAISPKMLLAPSTKDFRFLLEFLVRQIDQNFQFTGKFEEEVPIVFKRLGYPFPISKVKNNNFVFIIFNF